MADTFRLQGTYATTPLVGIPSGFPSLLAPIAESTQLGNKLPISYFLTTDAVQDVEFGGLAGANVLIVKVIGGPIRLRVTSTSGAQQAIPVDGFFVCLTYTTPITAVDIMRSPGVETTVELFLGELG